MIKLSGPGELTLNGKRYRIHRAETAKLKIKLSPAQLRTLQQQHKLKLELKIKFVPDAGVASSTSETITLRA